MLKKQWKSGECVSVLTAEPIGKPLDYLVGEVPLSIGTYVMVPLGSRTVLGVIWGGGDQTVPAEKLKTIESVLDIPSMSIEMQQFIKKSADYTMSKVSSMLRLATRVKGLDEPEKIEKRYSVGDVPDITLTTDRARVLECLQKLRGESLSIKDIMEKAKVSRVVVNGLIKKGALSEIEVPIVHQLQRLDPELKGKDLSNSQQEAADQLVSAVLENEFKTILLRGVTGSGKTEVYLEAVAKTLSEGRQALVMLPEIALGIEFIKRIEARFGAKPVEWHSGISPKKRLQSWKAIANGDAQLVVGARSALFLPYKDLGLIVVDEEHDGSYKQEEGVIYHARDMAVLRASFANAVVILATATPSLETWVNADTGRYDRVDLNERFGQAKLPVIKAIDMRISPPEAGQFISGDLVQAVGANIEKGEQSLLFLNRRGFAPLTICRACGTQIGCSQCDAKMVEHKRFSRLMCHQCGNQTSIPKTCPNCDVEGKLFALGPGVERLEEETAQHFPNAKIAVLSSDVAPTVNALKEKINDIANGNVDIIIGTQMVAKGHNFPNLTLVGVIDADLGLQGGDLRASEHTYQLVNQVAGRAGRVEKAGLTLLQTYQPDHPVIQAILRGDDEAFARSETRNREAAVVPPFGRMVGVIYSGKKERDVFNVAMAMVKDLTPLLQIGAQIFGPAPAPVSKIRGNYRVRVLIKAPKASPVQKAIAAWMKMHQTPRSVRIALDIDPQSFY